MQPKISILIPAYNVEHYIAECLRSVLSQTFSDMEIIVVDDGSTDGTLAEVQQFSDERIRLVEYENKGVSSARNRCVAEALGKYCLFVDADDYIAENTVVSCLEIAEKENAEVVAFDGQSFVDKQDVKQFLKERYFCRKDKLQEKTYSGKEFLRAEVENRAVMVGMPLYFFKTELLKSQKFYEGIVHEDALFHYEIMPKIQRLYYLPKTFYLRRIREGSIVHSKPNLQILQSYKVIVARLDEVFAEASQEEKSLYKRIIAKNMMQVGKLMKRYFFRKWANRKEALGILQSVLGTTLRLRKFASFVIGAGFYLFADLFPRKN